MIDGIRRNLFCLFGLKTVCGQKKKNEEKQKKVNLTDECKKVTLNISNFSLTLSECEISFQFLSSQAFNWDLKDCGLWSSLFIEPLQLNSGPSRRKRSWLMFHPVQAHCALIGWNYCTGMHPLISPKALILRSKLFNSHIKTCKILLRPRWWSASFFWTQTQEMIKGVEGKMSPIHVFIRVLDLNWTEP